MNCFKCGSSDLSVGFTRCSVCIERSSGAYGRQKGKIEQLLAELKQVETENEKLSQQLLEADIVFEIIHKKHKPWIKCEVLVTEYLDKWKP